MVSIITLGLVFLLIAVRRIGNLKFQIWQIMSLGAIVVLATGQITLLDALKSVNSDVMLFLFGMFVVGEAMESSGYLSYLSYRIFRKARSLDTLVLAVLFAMGLMSAFLMNDTLAIIGTPVVLLLARKANTTPKILMLALAFGITIGSVMSPIGNPQNLLIAIGGEVKNPFVTFFRYLLLPTLVNLFLAYLILRLCYRKHFTHSPVNHQSEPITDFKLAHLCRVSLTILIVLVCAKIILVFLGFEIDFRLTYIALAAALPLLVFSPKRFTTLRRIDWTTLIFFAAMFVMMSSVWGAGIFQSFIDDSGLNLTSTAVIMGLSVILSQFISNVPLVALYLPILMQTGVSVKELMALAAGSTIAGNLSILGAASNVIIIQNAERKFGQTLTFIEFVKVGIPMTLANILVYWVFFTVL